MQPPIRFSKTHLAKASNQSVKLTKNLPVVRNSPMAHLFTAKSLAAWELAVKSQVHVPRDDTPVGWRIEEPEEKVEQTQWEVGEAPNFLHCGEWLTRWLPP